MDLAVELIIGIGTIFFGILVWLVTRLEKLSGRMETSLELHETKMDLTLKTSLGKIEASIEKEREEGRLAHERVDVLDSIVGDLTDEKFNSRRIVVSNAPMPTARKLRRLVEAEE